MTGHSMPLTVPVGSADGTLRTEDDTTPQFRPKARLCLIEAVPRPAGAAPLSLTNWVILGYDWLVSIMVTLNPSP